MYLMWSRGTIDDLVMDNSQFYRTIAHIIIDYNKWPKSRHVCRDVSTMPWSKYSADK